MSRSQGRGMAIRLASPCVCVARLICAGVVLTLVYFIPDGLPDHDDPQEPMSEPTLANKPRAISSGLDITEAPTIEPMDPLYPRIPHSLYDHIYYTSYDGGSVYDNRETTEGATKRRPLRLEAQMFDQVRDKVTKYLSSKHLGTYTSDECSDIRYRHLPTVGVEVDVLCRRSSWPHVDRVTLMLPQVAPRIVFHTRPTATALDPAINIVVPLAGRSSAFHLFLDNLRQVMAPHTNLQFGVGLTVVYIEDGGSEAARAALESASAAIPRLHTDFLLLPPQKFSRARALKVGVEQSNITAPVVFLCDADVMFTHTFLTRCLATPVRGSQVFFPMVFSQYNPEMVYSLHGRRVPPPLQTLHVDDHSGFWRVWGHGMMCLYKSDFLGINGLDPRRTGWGGEDLGLLSKTAAMKYKIVRSLDYGLFHHYHPKNCSEAGRGQSWPCAKLRAMSEASSLSFGLWFFRHDYNSSSWGILRQKERWEERAREEEESMKKNGEKKDRWGKQVGREEEESRAWGVEKELRECIRVQQVALLLMLLLNLLLTVCLCWPHLLSWKSLIM